VRAIWLSGEPRMDTEFVNLTPHTITVFDSSGKKCLIEIPPSGQVARVATMAEEVGALPINGHDVPINRVTYGEVENLPEPQNGTIYIVSVLVLQALKGQRTDVMAPDTGPDSVVRDENGRIAGVRAFLVM